MQPPDKRQDDILFGDQFGTNGDRDSLAHLMGVDPGQITQQLDPNNRKRSYFHCGKLALFAAYAYDRLHGGQRGETLWQDLCRAREVWLGKGLRGREASADDKNIKQLCDEVTTALTFGDEDEKHSAMLKLSVVLNERLKVRLTGGEDDGRATFYPASADMGNAG